MTKYQIIMFFITHILYFQTSSKSELLFLNWYYTEIKQQTFILSLFTIGHLHDNSWNKIKSFFSIVCILKKSFLSIGVGPRSYALVRRTYLCDTYVKNVWSTKVLNYREGYLKTWRTTTVKMSFRALLTTGSQGMIVAN